MKTLPADFIKYTQALMGDKLYHQLEQGILEVEPPVSIRLNPFKCKEGEDAEGEPIPWCPATGRYLSARPNFTFDPLLHAGKYYVQEASSMFVDLVIRQLVHHPVMMLDLCAAPGGKSTAVRAALPEGSLLFSNEPMRTRSQILAENIQKFGHPDMIVTNNYPRDYKKSKLQFDVILTDVPCSGEGMFRKDDGAIEEWSLQNVDNCWHLQREIVADIWNCLKPGGILIYSTCTFNAHEDEENIAWICEELGAEPIALQDIEDSWNITGNLLNQENTGNLEASDAIGNLKASDIPVYRFLPGKTRGEGIFLAVLRKEGEAESDSKKKENKKEKKRKDKKGNKAKAPEIPKGWLKEEDSFTSITQEDAKENALYAIPSAWKDTYETAKQSLKVMHAGIKLATSKGKDWIPDQSLALSIALNPETFPQVELSYEDAIRYLRKEAVNLPADTPKGYVLVTYHNIPLGWEKNIGNRANNLYPQEWKIKSTHVPEEQRLIK